MAMECREDCFQSSCSPSLPPLPNPSWTRETNSSSHLFLLEDASYVLGKESAQKVAMVLEEPQYS